LRVGASHVLIDLEPVQRLERFMDPTLHLRLVATVLALLCAAAPVAAQQQTAPQGQTEEEEAPTPAPLTVGSLAIASDAALSIERMAVDVAVDRVGYAYRFRNKSQAPLALAASVGLPDLEVNNEETTVYMLPSQDPQNFVGLTVEANGKPVQTKPDMHAVALGIDRLSELKAKNLPLIPFGEATAKALAGMKPQALEELSALGLVTPRDPAEPDARVVADWSLHVVHGWTQEIGPNGTADVVVRFTPVKAVYTVDASSLAGFDALKEQVCLTPQIVAAAKALVGAKGATADVVDITLSNDGPARWLDNPSASVAVRKPQADSVVAFCGMDAATQAQSVVKGTMPSNADAAGLRVLIITRNPTAK
jgi:hypothetical protein